MKEFDLCGENHNLCFLPITFCLGFIDDSRVAIVAWASEDSLGGARSTTPAHFPTISVTSCKFLLLQILYVIHHNECH